MFTELIAVLRELTCPNCGVVGRMGIQEAQAYIQCHTCNKTHLDPFEVGPWESRIIERYNDEPVAAYYISNVIPDYEKNLDENRAEFMKFLYPDAANRKIEASTGTNTTADKGE